MSLFLRCFHYQTSIHLLLCFSDHLTQILMLSIFTLDIVIYLFIYFKDSPREILRKVWNDMIKDHFDLNSVGKPHDQYQDQVLTQNVVYMIYQDLFMGVRFNCSYAVAPEVVFKSPASWAMPNGSPLYPVIKYW